MALRTYSLSEERLPNMSATQTSRPTITVQPTTEPVTLPQAKKHLNLPSAVTFHDTELTELITQAREQWEHDTDSVLVSRTATVTARCFASPMYLPIRPVQSISSIQYYDGNNDQQTLSSAIYQLDAPNRYIRLAYQQNWPAIADRWDAITITFVAGHAGTTVDPVPNIAKRAILLQIGKWFRQRDMTENQRTAVDLMYERLVNRYMRSDYP